MAISKSLAMEGPPCVPVCHVAPTRCAFGHVSFPCTMTDESVTKILSAFSHDRARMLVMLYDPRSGECGICQHGPCDKRPRNMLACMLSGGDPMSAKRGRTLHADKCFRKQIANSSIACEESWGDRKSTRLNSSHWE